MPRQALRSEVVSAPPTAMFAAAKNYSIGKARRTPMTGSELQGEQWQDGAWVFYDLVGEFRYAVDWVGNLLSKAKLYVTKNGERTTDPVALTALDALFGGEEGQSEMLRMLGINFTVAGEAYIVGIDSGENDDWMVIASTEVRRDGSNGFTIAGDRVEGSKALVIRLWRPHPRKPKKSNSPARAVLPILAELDKLTQHVAAQIDSRLAGAGLLILPTEISFPAIPITHTDESGVETTQTIQASDAQGFVNMLIEVMEKAIEDRRDASALVPIVLQVAGEYIDKVQHLTFWSGLDEQAAALRTEAIRRLALGMDMPPEVLTGVADVNHWGAWAVDEAAIKSHSEPLLAVITSSLTMGYLRPALEADMSREEAEQYDIHADTSQLRLRPNRSKEALELWDRGVLSAEALLRENGFDPIGDLMAREELIDWFLRKVAGGSTTPELVAEALDKLGVVLNAAMPEREPTEAPQPRTLREHPTRDMPPEEGEVSDELVAAAEVMVFRALERAGNRLKTRVGGSVPQGVAAADLYLAMPALLPAEVDEVLTDAWSCTDRFPHGVHPGQLAAALDQYTRALMIFRRQHTPDQLRHHLSLAPRLRMLEAG